MCRLYTNRHTHYRVCVEQFPVLRSFDYRVGKVRRTKKPKSLTFPQHHGKDTHLLLYMIFHPIKQIQTYIWEHRDTIFSRIVTPDFTEPHNIKVFSSEPWEVLYKMLMTEYELWYILLKDMNLFGCEVSLPKMNESTIRADFLGCFTGENGLIVCELKVNKDPERQAYTELPAYATHIRGAFSPMGRNDIVYLLISPMEERITREATDRKSVV